MNLVNYKKPKGRAIEVLQLLAEGHTQKEIAPKLGTSASYVNNMTHALRNRYAPTNESLIALAVKLEWVRVEV